MPNRQLRPICSQQKRSFSFLITSHRMPNRQKTKVICNKSEIKNEGQKANGKTVLNILYIAV